MGRHKFDVVWAAPPRRKRPRLPAALAIGGVSLAALLLVIAIVALNSASSDPPSNDSAQTTAAARDSVESTTSTPPALLTSAVPVALPVTVLNNSAVNGLAARVAAVLEANGWPIADLRNYSETQVPATTVFFTSGAADEEAAALALVAQFPQIAGGAAPRFDGLDGVGLTLTAVGDWLP